MDIAEDAHLTVAGSSTRPVTFTAISDDSVGGDSNGDGHASKPLPGAYGIAVQFDHFTAGAPLSNASLSNAVFKFAGDALYYKFMSHDATVAHSDFEQNQKAIDVEETSGLDYDGVGDLPCVPPWFVGVVAKDDWFGPHGMPAPDLDLASFVGAHIPGKIPYSGTAFNLSGVSSLIDEESGNFGGLNTVPWAIYSCAKLPVSFPLTAVYVGAPPKGPNYRAGAKARARDAVLDGPSPATRRLPGAGRGSPKDHLRQRSERPVQIKPFKTGP